MSPPPLSKPKAEVSIPLAPVRSSTKTTALPPPDHRQINQHRHSHPTASAATSIASDISFPKNGALLSPREYKSSDQEALCLVTEKAREKKMALNTEMGLCKGS
ncbi:hypothetical protein D5086_022114 [Populus alba]|uniref:Uncharacterized protein n=1 Tax=Populus alba TaxID=43335 RepID=A0ACC4BEZ3_POPAL